MSPADPDLARIDAALIGIRRMWSHDTVIEDPRVGRIDLSTVLVADALVRTGQEQLTVAGLAHALDVTPSTASRLVTRAEKAGVVCRQRVAEDSRRVGVRLTPAGAALAHDAAEVRLMVLGAATSSWSAQERADFARLLTHLGCSVASGMPDRGGPP